ncbi:MAG TPA: hypothetical protein VN699_10695 [Pirellulales bacterium]|jgi:hypothetical protein|nr:hypothetical protein [Pirellulales bacterium]
MEFNRNHYFLAGIVLLLVGIQLRMVDAFVLNESTTRFLSQQSGGAAGAAGSILPAIGPTPRKTVRPPEWLGWALMSVGSVLVLHALAMKGPGAPS